MTFAEELKRIRQRSFLSQEAFAKKVNVSFSTVNRWETGKTRPNLMAMKSIKEYCDKNNVEFDRLEELWLSAEQEAKNDETGKIQRACGRAR